MYWSISADCPSCCCSRTTCFLLRKPRVLPVLWQLSVWFRGSLHTVHSLRSVRSTTVWHVTAETSRALSSHFYRNNHRSLSQLCASEPETFTDHCHTNRLTCWQHSETHSWRNNCKLLQNESCCTCRCLWYKCLQTWTVSRCCSAPVPVSAHRASLASYLHSSTQRPEEWAHSSTNRQRAGWKL